MNPVWLEVLHFGAVGAMGCFQLSAWIMLNRTVRHILWEKIDDLVRCRCGETRRSRSTLADMGKFSMADDARYREDTFVSGEYSSMAAEECGSVDFSSLEGGEPEGVWQ